MKQIDSNHNTNFKRWKSLIESKGIRKHKAFLISGQKIIEELLKQPKSQIREVLINEKMSKTITRPYDRFPISVLSNDLFKELDIFGTNKPLAVGQLPQIESWSLDQPPSGLEVFCSLGDPSNVGALLRVCHAFDVAKVILLKESAHPFHPKALRSSAGSSLRVPLAQGPSIRDLAGDKFIFALDSSGENLTEFEWPENVRILMGEEGPGIPDKDSFKTLSIPMNSSIESLNAVSASSIALFSYRSLHPKL